MKFSLVGATAMMAVVVPSIVTATAHVRLVDLLPDAAPPPPLPAADVAALQALLDAKALQYNMSLSVGVVSAHFAAFGVASGLADKVGNVPATIDSRCVAACMS